MGTGLAFCFEKGKGTGGDIRAKTGKRGVIGLHFRFFFFFFFFLCFFFFFFFFFLCFFPLFFWSL